MEIRSGTFTKDTTDGAWTLDAGTGGRHVDYVVNFPGAYATPPRVVVSLTYIDASNAFPLRLNVTVQSVNTDTFTVRFATWDNTRITGVGITYLVYGN